MKKSNLAQSAFFLIAIGGPFLDASSLINATYALSAVLLSAYLFRTSSPSYLAFCIWLWVLTPLVRRLVDYHTGYHSQSLVMLAPFLASIISIVSLRKVLGKRISPYVFPFLLIAAVVIWGYLVGILNSGIFAATYAALTWLSPLFLAIHIMLAQDSTEANTGSVFKTFEWVVLVIAVYGLYQFFFFPEWDRFWVANAEMGAIGFAEATSLRIFSTMNSPGVFALFLTAGLISTLPKKGLFPKFVVVIGISALMLSLVRSAWVCFLMGFTFILFTTPGRRRARYVLGAILISILSLPLLLMEPISGQVQSRLQSLTNLSNDTSFQARSNLYDQFSQRAIDSLIGSGLGSTGTASRLSDSQELTSVDSGIIDLAYTFGFLSILICFILFYICFAALRRFRFGVYGQASSAITLALIFQILVTNVLYAPTGVLFFLFSALAISQFKSERGTSSAGNTPRRESMIT